MFKLRLLPAQTDIKFIRFRHIWFVVSVVACLASVGLFLTKGLNYGIDFLGGITVHIATEGPTDIGKVRSIVGDLNLGEVQVQEFGAPDQVLIRIEEQEGGEEAYQDSVKLVKDTLAAELGQPMTIEGSEVIGPTVSGELVTTSTIAVLLAIVFMLGYIWFRFEWQFSLGAVTALVHDVVLTIGVFSLLQLEFALPIVAAILTIVGYSMNDTVVVYDRIRENLRKYKKMDLADLLNLSVNDTLSRTVMTSVTTLLALGSLYIWGGEVIRGFTFAMIWGVVIGTYSSIFVAAPILLVIGVRRDWSAETRAAAAT